MVVGLSRQDSHFIHFIDHISRICEFTFDIAMIDMPIGLPPSGYRTCDLMGREVLESARPRLFLGARRPLLKFANREAANRWAKKTDGKGVSCQLFCLLPKIKQVDDFLSPAKQKRIRETHPELIFQRLNAGRRLPNKKSADGFAERRSLLINRGFERLDDFLIDRIGTGAKADDVLDACACAIAAKEATTARRLTDGIADERGLQMEIWY